MKVSDILVEFGPNDDFGGDGDSGPDGDFQFTVREAFPILSRHAKRVRLQKNEELLQRTLSTMGNREPFHNLTRNDLLSLVDRLDGEVGFIITRDVFDELKSRYEYENNVRVGDNIGFIGPGDYSNSDTGWIVAPFDNYEQIIVIQENGKIYDRIPVELYPENHSSVIAHMRDSDIAHMRNSGSVKKG